MSQKRTITYIAFPTFVFLLCLFCYNLGFKRGTAHYKKEQISKVLDELEQSEVTPDTSKLTYYQELHSDKNAVVEQITQDNAAAKAKKLETSKTTKPVEVQKQIAKTEKPTPAVSVGNVSIQVGAFTDMGKADELTDKLKNSGFDAFTKSVHARGMELFRVLVSTEKSQTDSVQNKLATQGYKNSFVVKN